MARYQLEMPTEQQSAPETPSSRYVLEVPQEQAPEQKPLGDRLLRQAGLTGRNIIEGAANTIGLVSDPIAAVIGTAPASAVGTMVADKIGLPSPENSTERVVGDASKLLVGTGGLIKGAATAAGSVASPIAKTVLGSIAANPGMQAASSVGAGVSGGVARESGASPTGQVLAAVAGGVAVPTGLYSAKNSIDVIKNFLAKPKPAQVDAAIQQAGINLNELPKEIAQSIRSDVQKSLQNGQSLSPDALSRLADYKGVGATPTRGSLTLNPADVTRDRNLAKLGANSNDPAAQQLANVANENNQKLIRNINEMGASNADDAITAGAKVMDSLKAKDEQVKGAINQLYANARATDGRSAMIDPSAFTQKANNLLDEKLLGGKLPSDVRNRLNSIAKGETPLTVDVAEQFKTNIAGLQRASTDPAERLALSQVRSALDDAPLLEGQGKAAIDAFNKARKVNAAYMKMVERTPALQAVRDGVAPDNFVQTYIIGNGSKSNIRDLDALKKAVSSDKDALQTIKDQIIVHLKNKAVNNAADEVAAFSPSSYNKALKDIGDLKLSLFFSKGDIEKMKQIGRVASYEKVQPVGSAVNNSNTASAALAVLDRVANSSLLRKIPGGSLVANEAQNLATASGARNSLNAGKAIRGAASKAKPNRIVPVAPALLPLSASAEDPSNDN